MGITDYLSRDPTFEAPEPEDESELAIDKIRELDVQRNTIILRTAAELISFNTQPLSNNKRTHVESDKSTK